MEHISTAVSQDGGSVRRDGAADGTKPVSKATPLAVLVSILLQKDRVPEVSSEGPRATLLQLAGEYCRSVWPSFPDGCETLFMWRVCWMAGIGVPYVQIPHQFRYALEQAAGFRFYAADSLPEIGDIAVCLDESGRPVLEFVCRASTTRTSFCAVDPASAAEGKVRLRTRLESPPDGFKERSEDYNPNLRYVQGWLRFHCPECMAKRQQ